MKYFNLRQFLGCSMIGVCIIIASVIISDNLPVTPHIPSNLSISTSDGIRWTCRI